MARGKGRPKKDVLRSKSIHIKVTEAENSLIVRHAEHKGMNRTEYILSCVRKDFEQTLLPYVQADELIKKGK